MHQFSRSDNFGITGFGKLVLPGLILIHILAGVASGQSETPSIDSEREILVMFRQGEVTPPPGRSSGEPGEFEIPSQELRQILYSAEAMARLMPDFSSGDTLGVAKTGEVVRLTDWSRVYVVRLPRPEGRVNFIQSLQARPEVVYAEPNGRGEPDLTPNDYYFNRQWALKNDGTLIQGSGTAGADISAPAAWEITTGSPDIKIGIVDGGMQTNHPDFAGRVTGDPGDNDSHGTAVAGVAAAQGNNSVGVAGVAWNVGIINEDYDPASDADFAAAVRSAANRGADVINNSWKLVPVGRYSHTVRRAFVDVYKLNRVAVASMGNQYGEVIQYPAAFGQGIITVGATTNTDIKADYSSTGSWIDVTAPGGGAASGETADQYDYIYTTRPDGIYGWFGGTSFAAPVVSGVSALLLSYNPNLYNDDIEQIIRLGVDNIDPPGFDPWYGTGRVNARKALDFLRPPYTLNQWEAIGGTINFSVWWDHHTFYGINNSDCTFGDATYTVVRHRVEKTVTFPTPFESIPYVWGRGVGTIGYSAEDPNFTMGWCEVVPGTITNTQARLRTYIYDLYFIDPVDGWPEYLCTIPTSAENVTFAYTALAEDLPPAAPLNLSGTTGQGGHPYLTWDANIEADLVGYHVYRKNENDVVTQLTEEPITETEFLDTESYTGWAVTVWYFVKAVDYTEQLSDASNEVEMWLAPGPLGKPALAGLPNEFDLHEAFPNPFNPTTTIRYSVPTASQIFLKIYDLLGKEIETLFTGHREAGNYEMIFDASSYASGVYFCHLTAPGFSQVVKLSVVK